MDDTLYFSEPHHAVRDMVRAFARAQVAPVAARHDADASFPWETVKAMGDLGLLGIPWSEELGGAGFDTLAFMVAIEELAKVLTTQEPLRARDGSEVLDTDGKPVMKPVVDMDTKVKLLTELAQYTRPKLKSVEVVNKGPELTDEQIDRRLEALLAKGK